MPWASYPKKRSDLDARTCCNGPNVLDAADDFEFHPPIVPEILRLGNASNARLEPRAAAA